MDIGQTCFLIKFTYISSSEKKTSETNIMFNKQAQEQNAKKKTYQGI